MPEEKEVQEEVLDTDLESKEETETASEEGGASFSSEEIESLLDRMEQLQKENSALKKSTSAQRERFEAIMLGRSPRASQENINNNSEIDTSASKEEEATASLVREDFNFLK